jgi:hypothetical protein
VNVTHPITSLTLALLLALACAGQAAQTPAQSPAKPNNDGLTPEQIEMVQRLSADFKDLRAQVGRLPDGLVRQQMLQTINRLEADSRRFAELTGAVAKNRMAVPADVLAKLLKALQDQNFDGNRLPILKRGSADAHFTCDQARSLVTAFVSSDARKRAAILLYPHVLDPANFSAVLNAIPFNTDREDVLRAISVK